MKPYLLSLAAGVLVGVIYATIHVRSPAPPMVALVGLFGILMGEQLPVLIHDAFANTPAVVTWLRQIKPHMFGALPSGFSARPSGGATSQQSP